MSAKPSSNSATTKILADVSNRQPKKKRTNNDEKDRPCSRKKKKSSKFSDSQYPLNSTMACKPMKSYDDDDNQQEASSWLEELELSIPDLSLVPMSAASVVKRIEQTLNHVQTQYVPLVAFLVHCQVALENTNIATNVKNMKPRACHNKYIFPLSQVFTTMNMSLCMNAKELAKADRELVEVSNHAKKGKSWTEMKQLFIGGMMGQSSGLYRWISDLGNARSICCDLECILQVCCKLDTTLDTTRKLAKLLRNMTQPTLDHLMKHVPNKYHLHSTTVAAASNQHPPPPYFHRLEAAMRSMATFNPNDDEIVCVGDPKKASHAAAAVGTSCASTRKNDKNNNHEIISIDDSDDDDEVIKKKSNDNKKKSEPEVICIDDSDDDSDGDEMRWI